MVLPLEAWSSSSRRTRTRTGRARTGRCSRALEGLEGLEVRSLYDLYPDFSIDVAAEQAALLRASTVVWQHPIYWYTAPALLKLWFEKVLLVGWAYGKGGTALHGKQCLWVVTAGADDRGYSATGEHQYPFEAFVPVVQQTAQFCGMRWLEPLVVKAAHRITADELTGYGARYRERLEALVREDRAGTEGVRGE